MIRFFVIPRLFIFFAVLLVVATGFWLARTDSSARGDLPAAGGRLVVTGSSTVAPLVAEIGRRFEELHPGVRVDVQSGGSSRGLSDVRRGLADAAMISRALLAEESDLKGFPLARDGIGILVHAENPLRGLTHAQVVEIFSGRIHNWSQLGGPNATIVVVNKAEGRSTREVFLEHFRLKGSDLRSHAVIGDNEQGIKTVAGNRYAVGYVSIGSAEYSVALGVPVRLLVLEGVEAGSENVLNGSYPLSRPLLLVTPGEPAGRVLEFVNFAASRGVDDLIRQQHFVPIPR